MASFLLARVERLLRVVRLLASFGLTQVEALEVVGRGPGIVRATQAQGLKLRNKSQN